jgi:hypothetical protein
MTSTRPFVRTVRYALSRGILAAGVLLTSAVPLAAQGASVTARNAFAFETMPGRNVTAVFVTLENRGSVPRALVRGATPAADTLELHEMKREDGMMKMSPVKSIEIPANGTAELRPGGLHLMLFGVRKPLAAGDSITVSLTLDDGSVLSVGAEVRKRQGMMR